MSSKEKCCLVLEGGGVKCAYQFGVLDVLTKAGFSFDAVSGTSFGSLNCALYLSGGIERMRQFWETLSAEEMFNEPRLDELTDKIYKKESLFDIKTLSFIISEWSHPQKKREEISKLYRELVMKNVDEEKIRESKTDFGFVTLEIPNYKNLAFEGGMSLLFPLTTMARMMFNKSQGKTLLEYFSFVPYELMADEVKQGKLADYIAASANNFIFTPMEIDNKRFTDGGVYDNLPIKMMEDKGYRKFFCIRVSTSDLKLKCSDNLDITMITPTEDTGNCAMFNVNNIKHLIELGRKDALAFIKTLKGDSYEKIEF